MGLLLLLGGCSPGEAIGPYTVTAVAVSPSRDTIVGALTLQLVATTTNHAGEVLEGRLVTWATSNPSVATVSNEGVVRGVAAGAVTITAASGTASGTAELTVLAPATEVTVHPTADTLLVGWTRQLTAITRDAGGNALSGREVTWASDNPAAVTVTATGLVTAVGSGTATITATSEGSEGKASLLLKALTVQPNGIETILPTVVRGDAVYYTIAVPAGRDSLVVSAYFPMQGSGIGDPNVFLYSDTSLATLVCSSNADGPDQCRVARPAAGTYALKVVARTTFAGYVLRATSHAPFVVMSAGTRCALVPLSAGGNTLGQAYCWGPWPLGNGVQLDGNASRLVPTPVATRERFASISSGGISCGLTAAGAASCWGVGVLGDGQDDRNVSPTAWRRTPVAVAGGLTFRSVSVGSSHACGVTTGSVAYCWGRNTYGQLGDGTTTDRLVPTPVAGGLAFASISAGLGENTCGLLASGAAYCWGANFNGTIGDGSFRGNHFTPTPVAGGLSFRYIGTSGGHACGLTTAGAAYCWGTNYSQELGSYEPYYVDHRTPWPVAGGLTFATLSVGYRHTCAATSSGIAYCWGVGYNGELGTTTPYYGMPVRVDGALRFTDMSAGIYVTCGRTISGALYCWGLSRQGELGDGTTTDHPTPWPVLSP